MKILNILEIHVIMFVLESLTASTVDVQQILSIIRFDKIQDLIDLWISFNTYYLRPLIWLCFIIFWESFEKLIYNSHSWHCLKIWLVSHPPTKIRDYIKACVRIGKVSEDIFKEMCDVYRNKCMSFRKFKFGSANSKLVKQTVLLNIVLEHIIQLQRILAKITDIIT